MLTGGRRTALPRHQTLQTTLDSSHELLSDPERALLRRLAVFVGSFSLQATSAVAAGPKLAPRQVVDCVSSLAAKSLVTIEASGGVARFRLLDTTRAYALQRLAESGEREALARRHAEYYRDVFEQAEAERNTRPANEWLGDLGRQIANLRAALDWAFSPSGDASIGVTLTAAAIPLWMHLSLTEECGGRIGRALAAIEAGAAQDARREMQLHTALAVSLLYTSPAVSEIGTVATRAIEIAESLGNPEYQLRALWALGSLRISCGQQRLALTQAERFHALAMQRSDPSDRLIGSQMIGIAHHYLGDQLSARCQLEHMATRDVAPAHYSQLIRFTDAHATARLYLARVMWLQGSPDQAMRIAASGVAQARATNHEISVGHALALAACPIALAVGDLAAADHYVEMLLDHSTRHALARWRAVGSAHRAMLVIQRGDLSSGLRMLRAAFADPAGTGSVPRLFAFPMAEALGHAGQADDGLAAIEQAIIHSERGEERRAAAEMLRIKGELLLAQGAFGAAASAECYFRQALELASRQGALSWELRAATNLARLLRDQGHRAEAKALLQPVYDRFTEGFDTADLKAARALMDGLC
jgi:predicted ATPase